MFPGSLGQSLSGRALADGKWSYNAINIRDYADNKHGTVDDTPYGGGAGMVLRPDVLENTLLSIPPQKRGRLIYMSPRGRVLDQKLVEELTAEDNLTILCGRYEGVDQRFLDAYDIEEISVGDYVLSGGEPAAIIMMDACIRLLDGVMGNEDTAGEESFSNGLLEYPHYTRPAEWTDANGNTHAVPEILKNGHHAKIKQWQHEQSLALTKFHRPDLLFNIAISQEDAKALRDFTSIEDIASEIVDSAFKVHKTLGPGLLENIYEVFLFEELTKRGLKVEKQKQIPLKIYDQKIDNAFRADLIVNDQILIELKSVENIMPVHKAQTISYLKIAKLPLGFLINFNSALIKDGIRRFTNEKNLAS